MDLGCGPGSSPPQSEQPDILRILQRMRTDQLPDAPRWIRAWLEFRDQVDEGLQSASGEPEEEVFLTGEVPEEGPGRDAGGFGDLFHRDVSESLFGKKTPGDLFVFGLQQASAPLPATFVHREGHGKSSRNLRPITSSRRP